MQACSKLNNKSEIRGIFQTQPYKTSLPRKKPNIIEIKINSIKEPKKEFEFAYNNLGKEIRVRDVLKDGDLLNIDVTTYFKKFHGDTNKTFFVGNVSAELQKLVEVTYECMEKGIAQALAGARLGNIGHAIETHAHAHGYSVVREYCGHGIGREFHEEPQVFHHYTLRNKIRLQEGMTFTIEPMINMGSSYEVKVSPEDGWTVRTQDGSRSAQFEHTILVASNGAEILTKV